ncbi:MAG: fibrobacter succinogenes major paralogous domain-containing protein [Fibromonadaceae bacterium]|jgi:uncharacterized protein (TIGR02145 family)|nr:fibrobacter succinogenes major paralogous domain-containing protein [Fibromonadaceae bacterium]
MTIRICLIFAVFALTAYGQQRNSFTDSRDGKKYKTAVIGKQTWMAENLNYETGVSKCYDKKIDNCDKYGRLYNWSTAKAACPKGWHLPDDKDWNVLMKFVSPSCSDNTTCEGAGIKLKATNGWDNYRELSGNGTDNFGFAALPGGYGYSYGNFNNIGNYGSWWSASDSDAYIAYSRLMYYSYEGVHRDSYDKNYLLFSVRCVKD